MEANDKKMMSELMSRTVHTCNKNLNKALLISSVLIMLCVLYFAHESSAATDLKLNNELDYNSDSDDGPLIRGNYMTSGKTAEGKPAYIIFYQSECFNSKRQAKRTVSLYEKYKEHIDFIVVDLDSEMSSEQRELVKRFYNRYIPHVTILNGQGNVVYDRSGEASEEKLSGIIDRTLKQKIKER